MKVIIVSALLLYTCMHTAAGQTAAVHISIDPEVTYQTIDNFGASDAWSTQFVGNWPAEKKNRMADWLFSTDTTATGQPKGIGLSLWRYNIGAGSAEQGESSGIKDEWHRANSWQTQSGQLWFLQAAKERKVKQFLAFLNSPPVSLTLNGRAFADKGNSNIGPDKYDAFAAYIADALEGIHKATGTRFDFISPVNEPQWDWSDNKQEGCPYNNDQISALTRSLSKTLTARKLSTKIVIGEAGQLNYLFDGRDKPAKGKQINAFFDISSPQYLGNLPNVYHNILGHSYFTTSPNNIAVQVREEVAKHVKQINGLGFWQSEYCILGDNAGEINGEKRDYGMEAALYLARVIHNDLTIANATAWQYWLAISPYDYKDGLIYIDKNKQDGEFRDSKMLWALGNYSRFVRPGAKRIRAEIQGDSTLLVSAYKNTDRTISVVIVNNANENKHISLDRKKGQFRRLRSYVTSETDNLHPLAVNNSLTIPARAVVTVTESIN
ncbi:glycoside hydrolase family 30 protein [Chitinophaga filiformis]|uniref:O-Glycosyl hydrolase n=1 Tax=Chitinophaga filiformis TaxID=104663 RepID=A0A1G7M6H4_CHIFI|nr:glycoside hydrolase family 30 protein [Chitinophaga filiformis]SDF56779.1 O-Glycosyl hydrolase [Chitinophaga filiformis]